MYERATHFDLEHYDTMPIINEDLLQDSTVLTLYTIITFKAYKAYAEKHSVPLGVTVIAFNIFALILLQDPDEDFSLKQEDISIENDTLGITFE